MKLLQLNDPHLSDKAPLRRTAIYLEEVFAKLYEVRDIANSLNVDALVIPGDLFHQKTATRVSYFLTMRVLKWIADVGKPILVLPGNHDLTDNNLSSLIKQPLGMARFMSNVIFLGPYDTEWKGYHFWGVPGVMTEFTVDKFFTKTPWQDTIVVAHGPIVVDERLYPYEVIRAKDIAGRAFLVLYGHVHTSIEPVIISRPAPFSPTMFVNPGAISRGTIGVDDLKRTPQVAIIDIDEEQIGDLLDVVDADKISMGVKVRYVPLKTAKPVEEVYLLEEVQTEKEQAQSVDEFLSNLVEAKVAVVSRESLAKAIDEASAPQDIRDLARVVLEETN